MSYPLSREFQLSFEDLRPIAHGVVRPECVLALADGRLLTGHGSGGYSVVETDGSVRHVLAKKTHDARTYHPNGIAIAPSGQVLFAHLGMTDGGVFSIEPDGFVESVVETLDGKPLPPTNYVTVDDEGTVWFTVSTTFTPRSLAWNKSVLNGFIGKHDAKGTRIVADGLGYTNEIAFSPDGRWLYANETYAQRVSKFERRTDGSLGPRETVAQFDGADLPDGLTFDAFGGVWITCIASNRLLLVRPEGEVQVVLADSDEKHVAKIVAGVLAGNLAFEDMQGAGNTRLGNASSLAFGGPDMKTAYLGSLLSDCVRVFDCPIEGAKPLYYHRTLA